MKNRYQVLVRYCLCSILLFWSHTSPTMAANPAVHSAQIIAHWKSSGPILSTEWSAKGDRVLYSIQVGKQSQIKIYHLGQKKHADWGTSLDRFWPSFGPVGTLVGGPSKTPTKAPPKKGKGKPAKPGRGIYLIGKKRQSFLYPGWQPAYSFAARRLLFSFKGVMYVWNPLARTRKKSLVLLSRGYQPRWAHNGRAIAFLRKPFSVDAKGVPKGGGIWVVDMLFRAGKLTTSGGEVAWSTNNRSLAYVDAYKQAGKATKAALYWRTLKKAKRAKRVAIGGRSPALPSRKHKQTNQLLAYHDAKGVWIAHLKTLKKKLIAPGASHAAWSSKGHLLVRYPKGISLLRLASTLQATLSR